MHQAGQWHLLEKYILVADPGRHVRQHRPARYSTVAQKVPITIWSASTFLGPVHLARTSPPMGILMLMARYGISSSRRILPP